MDTSQSKPLMQSAHEDSSPIKRIGIACKENDISALSSAISDCTNIKGNPGKPYALNRAVTSAIYNGNTYILRWLVEEQGVDLDVEHISPSRLTRTPSLEFLQFFLDRGWDINKPGGLVHKQERIMQMLCCQDDGIYVPWCLASGARVFLEEDLQSEPDYDPEVIPCPPILDSLAAGGGTIENFKLLQQHGAKPGQRTLHLAVRHAAVVVGNHHKTQESINEGKDRSAETAAAWQMLKFLVEDLGMDVNAKDTLTPMPGSYRGSPIAYAADVGDGYGVEEVVRWLLEKVADPRLTDCWGHSDAIRTAERAGGTKVAGIMREWVAARLEK